jgi:hypothetical protein
MKLEEMRQIVEFLSFDKDPSEKIFGYVRARFNKIFVVIFPVIQKKDGDLFVANPSKSINVMGQWKPSDMVFFEQREDRDHFSSLAKDFVRLKTNGNGATIAQNNQGYVYPHTYQQNQIQANSGGFRQNPEIWDYHHGVPYQ